MHGEHTCGSQQIAAHPRCSIDYTHACVSIPELESILRHSWSVCEFYCAKYALQARERTPGRRAASGGTEAGAKTRSGAGSETSTEIILLYFVSTEYSTTVQRGWGVMKAKAPRTGQTKRLEGVPCRCRDPVPRFSHLGSALDLPMAHAERSTPLILCLLFGLTV